MLDTLNVPAYRFRNGFTIIELLVTLVIVSMLAATAMLAVRLPLRQAELKLVIEQIQSIDALARAHAIRGELVSLHLLPAERKITLMTHEGSVLASRQTPSHASILRIMVHNQGVGEAASRVDYERGASPTFAILLGNQSKGQCWMLICGLSGEAYRFDKHQGDRIVTSLLAQTWNVAD